MTIAVVFSETPEGEAALASAVREARLRGTDLAVLNVTEGDDAPEPEHLVAVQARAAAVLPPTSELPWEVHVVSWAKNLAGAIVDLAVEVGADLLVMGTRRRSVTGKFLLGSTVQRVLLDAPMEVLTVKAHSD
ncbi:MAG: universal stress protein [Gordonia sp. (in: high G+C Gram-positive bacteria)]|uniref:universal stress protein n=1 Tax=Gordonia sp. (in: high G+C Gram-positive bacteria) TaxID=84139 RepID=UPI0039E277D4